MLLDDAHHHTSIADLSRKLTPDPGPSLRLIRARIQNVRVTNGGSDTSAVVDAYVTGGGTAIGPLITNIPMIGSPPKYNSLQDAWILQQGPLMVAMTATGGFGASSRAMAIKTSTQEVPNITPTVVSWDSLRWDKGAGWFTTNLGLKVPYPGLYLVTASLIITPGGNAQRRIIYIEKVASPDSAVTRFGQSEDYTSTDTTLTTAAMVDCYNTNDLIRLVAYQASGVTLNISYFHSTSAMAAIHMGFF